jgi:hypothetical protein
MLQSYPPPSLCDRECMACLSQSLSRTNVDPHWHTQRPPVRSAQGSYSANTSSDRVRTLRSVRPAFSCSVHSFWGTGRTTGFSEGPAELRTLGQVRGTGGRTGLVEEARPGVRYAGSCGMGVLVEKRPRGYGKNADEEDWVAE